MRPVLAAALGSALMMGACASPTALREGAPVLQETTTTGPHRVAGCIGDRLEAENSALSQIQYSTRPTARGYSIEGYQSGPVLWGGTDTILLIDIARVGERTRVRMYTHFLVGDGPSRYFEAVRECL